MNNKANYFSAPKHILDDFEATLARGKAIEELGQAILKAEQIDSESELAWHDEIATQIALGFLDKVLEAVGLVRARHESLVACDSCGKGIKAGFDFCPYCGDGRREGVK